MRLSTCLVLAGLLTGVSLGSARAEDDERGNCPPPPAGGPPQFEQGAGEPPRFDRREHGPGARFQIQMPLAEFDLDKDGRISREEIDRALRARFNEADTNHDGNLDTEEFAHAGPMMAPPFGGPPPFGRGMHHRCHPGWGPRDEAAGGDHPKPPREMPPFDPKVAFNHFDWNLDGELSFEEFAAPIRQMALHLDRNGDGVIDADELKGPKMFFGPPPGQPPEPPRDR